MESEGFDLKSVKIIVSCKQQKILQRIVAYLGEKSVSFFSHFKNFKCR